MLCGDILEPLFSLEAYSLINNIEQWYIIDIYYIYSNIIIELDVILNCEFESTKWFPVLLIVITELSKVL